MLLSVEGLRTYIESPRGLVRCVEGAGFSLQQGETLGLVGESGCGKTMTARSIVGLVEDFPGVIEGEIWFSPNGDSEPIELTAPLKEAVSIERDAGGQIVQIRKNAKHWRREINRIYKSLRGHRISIIFQDPQTSLNPYWTVGAQLGEAVILGNPGLDKEGVQREVLSWLERVHINFFDKVIAAYPHELSGGMCQRIMIAIAMASKPDLIIADEPTTGLDVTIQAHIVDLFEELKNSMGITMLLISHDIGLIGRLADRIAVMYGGSIVETAPKEEILDFDSADRHPYTVALLKTIPSLDTLQASERLPIIEHEVPDPVNPPPGCAFHPRCTVYSDNREGLGQCAVQAPQRTQVNERHWAKCWNLDGPPNAEQSSA